jgi:hypothetical protein
MKNLTVVSCLMSVILRVARTDRSALQEACIGRAPLAGASAAIVAGDAGFYTSIRRILDSRRLESVGT